MTLARRLPQVTRTLLAGQKRVRTETRASSASGYVSSVTGLTTGFVLSKNRPM